jgi:hypothetical protein
MAVQTEYTQTDLAPENAVLQAKKQRAKFREKYEEPLARRKAIAVKACPIYGFPEESRIVRGEADPRGRCVALTSRTDRSLSKVATAPKLVSPRNRSLDPCVKSWIDNVIVPTLVREYLASEKKSGESLNCDAPMVTCSDCKASPEEGQ